jgi:exosortase
MVTTSRAAPKRRLGSLDWRDAAPIIGAAVAFGVLFWQPIVTLGRDWWSDPEAGHGLLLGPLAIFLAWRKGWGATAADGQPSTADRTERDPFAGGQAAWGIAILVGAVGLRYLSGLAAELFTMRASLLLAICGLVVFLGGFRQLIRWWLPVTLLALSIPLPAVVLGSLAFPLQLKASQLGAILLDLRHVPVQLAGNVLHIPGQSLFVTEACSGLRSLTALLALGVLIGGLWLRTIPGRLFIVLAAIPVAMLLNGVRIFLTGFSAYFVSPSLAEGIMHYSEGWAMFVVAFAILGALSWLTAHSERLVLARRSP